MTGYRREIEEAIDLLEDLYPNKVIDVSTTEESASGEPTFAVEDHQVTIKMTSGEKNAQNTDHENSGIKAIITKTRIYDGNEAKVEMPVDIEDFSSVVTSDFHMFDLMLERLRMKNQK